MTGSRVGGKARCERASESFGIDDVGLGVLGTNTMSVGHDMVYG
jgi:hypothetical protein